MKDHYDIIYIVFIHTEQCYGSVEKLGAFVSEVKYIKEEKEYIELMDNEDFTIVDEIVHVHSEE